MKQLEFETSKGRFLLIDSKDAPSSFSRYLRDIEEKLDVQLTIGYKLSEITEEEASEIIGIEIKHKSVDINRLMLDTILQSKGVHLFKNPHPRRYIMAMTDKGIVDTTEKLYLEAEQKHFTTLIFLNYENRYRKIR